MPDILNKANKIVNNRSEEKLREYGDFSESMAKAAKIATEICNKEITTEDMFKCMVALKLSRIAYKPKEDSLLDAVAYLGGYDNFVNGIKTKTKWQSKRKKPLQKKQRR